MQYQRDKKKAPAMTPLTERTQSAFNVLMLQLDSVRLMLDLFPSMAEMVPPEERRDKRDPLTALPMHRTVKTPAGNRSVPFNREMLEEAYRQQARLKKLIGTWRVNE